MAECRVDECAARAVAGCLCNRHYLRLRRHGDVTIVNVGRRPPTSSSHYSALLRRGVTRRGECLLIGGATSGGYVQISVSGHLQLAHRVSYAQWRGPIPDGYQVDHECHNSAAHRGECLGGPSCNHRRCVNPAHLAAKSPGANRAASPLTPEGGSTRLGDFNRAKTHCPRQHPYDAGNTIWRLDGGRDCRTCQRNRKRRYE